MGEAWYTTLHIVARYKPLAFWRTTYGAAFWWCPDEAELLPGGFATQPFTYAEVESVTVFDDVWGKTEWSPEDWLRMRAELLAVEGMQVREERDVACPPAHPPNQALHLTAGA